MKTSLQITSYILVLAIGLGGGFYLGFSTGQGRKAATEMSEFAHYSAYMQIQMSEGSDAAREEAIKGFLVLLEKYKGHQSPPLFTERVYAMDSALSYARLSALAQRRGATSESQQLLERAVSFCPQIGWQECSAEKVVHFARQLDKPGLFKAAGSQ